MRPLRRHEEREDTRRCSGARRTATDSRPVSRCVFALLLTLSFGTAAHPAGKQPTTFGNLRASTHSVVTTHGLDHALRMPHRFHVASPEHRTDTFNGHPFRISLTAFLSKDAALMVHAETVADDSGASNYDALPMATLAGLTFHRRPDQCVNLSKQQLEGEHDLLWLADHGFPPTGPLQVRQYLTNNPQHDREIVLTFMLRVADCTHAERNRLRLHALIGLLKIDGKQVFSATEHAPRNWHP